MSASAVYEGWVRHRRFEPVEHEFRYRFFLTYLDLGELPEVLDPYPLWSARRPRPPGSAAPTSSATRRAARRRRRDGWWPSGSGTAPPARSACSPACATSATPSTR